MPVIPLVPSDSPTLISSLLRLSAHHLALADTALQPLKSGTLSLYLTVPVPVLTPFVVTSRPTTASRHSTPLNPSPLAPQIRLWTIVCVYKLYLLTLSWNVGLRQVFFWKLTKTPTISQYDGIIIIYQINSDLSIEFHIFWGLLQRNTISITT